MRTNFLGLKLKNPVIVAAGPWNRDGKGIRRSLDSGAGAVITETIVSDPILDVRPRIAYDGLGAQNIRLYSDVQIEGWEREMDIAKSNGGIVIASVSAHTPSELAYLAVKMEKFGADAIELSVSSPMGEYLEVIAADADELYSMVKSVVDNVKIPVMAKLSQNTTNISRVAKAAKKAGASGVSAINTVRCILGVNVETGEPLLPAYGGYSGPPIKPLGLASVATIAQTVDIPICGIGGIANYKNALEYIMLGACAVQIGTAAMVGGMSKVTEIIEGLQRWGEENGIKEVKEIKGKALSNLRAFDDIKIEPVVCRVGSHQCSTDCSNCLTSCIYDAMSKDEKGVVKVDEEKCGGCGLCTFTCREKNLTLGW